MTQIEAINMVERTLAGPSVPGIFAMLFNNVTDYDRVEDALTDIGYIVSDSPMQGTAPFDDVRRLLESVNTEHGAALKLLLLMPPEPKEDPSQLRPHRKTPRPEPAES